MNLKKITNKCILLGGGRSVKEGIDLGLWSRIKDKADIWSLNYSYKFMDFVPDKQLWVDTIFFKNNINDLRDLHHKGVELVTKKADLYENFPVIQFPTFRSINERLNYPDSIFIGQLGLTGTFALSLACKMDYKEIYLLGYDYGTPSLDNKMTHYYLESITDLNIKSSGANNPRVYLDANGSVKGSVRDYVIFEDFHGIIYNVSLITNISNFKIISYPTFFELLKES